ncbi:hypothetical protein Glove_143g35 [Diversispora epigaea]|uniref:Uncharacterized protein n=1 Tax=Diversispora epigaea TaxID=1348612 RepID=A0A397J0S5_9GLOM|nr:hypothetical protein Glove_143g35 [Diversispora epigaea]
MASIQSTIDFLKELNSNLVYQITELRKKFAKVEVENIEVKTENAKLKQDMEEYSIKFVKLEQNDKEKTSFIAKLDKKSNRIKLLLFYWKQSQIHSDKETSVHCETNDSITNITPIISKQIISQKVDVSASHIYTEAKSLEDKEMDNFLDSTYKEKKNIQSNFQHESMSIDLCISTLSRIFNKSEQISID